MPAPGLRFSSLQHGVQGSLAAACLIFFLSGCSDAGTKPDSAKPAVSNPTLQTSQPAASTQPSEKPATSPSSPESKPAEAFPASTYDSHPPYPVELHVHASDDPQPGWLHVIQLDADDIPAAVHGQFPEQNLMVVDTQNVRRIEIHVGHLPLAPRKRLVLRIDGQGIELIRDEHQFVTLVRQKTGAWQVESRR